MPTEASEWNWIVALLVLAEFVCLALLGFLLVQVMHWESTFTNCKDRWLAQIKVRATQLRRVRRKLDTLDGEWPQIPLPPAFKKKWKTFRWIYKALCGTKWARS